MPSAGTCFANSVFVEKASRLDEPLGGAKRTATRYFARRGGGVSDSWDAASGTLTLTGTASTWDYEWSLQRVTYENTSDTPDATVRTISLTVNDGIVDSNTVTRDINV